MLQLVALEEPSTNNNNNVNEISNESNDKINDKNAEDSSLYDCGYCDELYNPDCLPAYVDPRR